MTERRESAAIDELQMGGERSLSMTADTADCCCPDFCERDHGNE